jgi:hypothetical protein
MASIADRQRDDFPRFLGEVHDAMRRVDPIHLAAMIIGWGTMGAVGPEGTTGRTMIAGIEQHHLELLLALLLMLPRAEWGARPPVPADVQSVVDALQGLADAFHQRRYKEAEQERSDQQRMVLMLQEQLRLHTQVVRNWGYESDVRAISRSLFSPLDERLRPRHGFGASDLMITVEALEQIVQGRLNRRFAILKRVFSQKSIRQCVRVYYRDYPGITGDPDDFLAIIPKDASLDAVRSKLLAHADLSLAGLMLVEPAEVAETCGIPEATVQRALNAISHEPGSLTEVNPDFVFMANPVWTAPGIRIGTSYFMPMPHVLFSFIIPCMRGLCDTPDLKRALEERRAAFLEEQVEAGVRKAFPKTTIVPRASWTHDGRQFETDVLVVCDRTLLIFEAKSASLTPEALRGAPDRVRRHVEDLVVAPAVQSARLVDVIHRAQSGDAACTAALAHLPFDPKAIDQIARVSVTLDDFSVLATSETELQAVGWIPDGVRLAATLNLADLNVIFDILERPLFVIDYLIERERLQRSILVVGDELDHLGLYLETAFNFAGFEQEKGSLMVSGMSAPIDHYYTSRDAGIRVPKPSFKLHPYFRDLLGQLEERERPGWTTLGRALLHLCDAAEQKRLVAALETARTTVMRDFRKPGHQSTLVVQPPAPRDTIGLFHVFTKRAQTDPRDVAAQIAAEAMQESGLKRCVAILRSVEEWESPYRFAAIMTAAT